MDEVRRAIRERSGEVMGKGTILKADHYLGGHQYSPVPFRLSGAPNFRQVVSLPIFGVAQPTVFGFRAVLNRLCMQDKEVDVVWVNLREECVIYINGRPFVLREWTRPLTNLRDYKGMKVDHLEDMEARLKRDILAEAAKYHGNILVHDEIQEGTVSPLWEAITEDNVLTPKEVFAKLAAQQGYKVRYARIPVTPERAPETKMCTALLGAIRPFSQSTRIVFNCQMGKGRSTTAMVMASLMYMWYKTNTSIGEGKLQPHTSSSPSGTLFSSPSSQQNYLTIPGTRSKVKPDRMTSFNRFRSLLHTYKWKREMPRHEDIDGNQQFRDGDYKIVMNLVRTLRYGIETKLQTDLAIDLCEMIENQREIILEYRLKHETARTPEESESYLLRALTYLERYVWLIVFNSYLSEEASHNLSLSFDAWLKERPEITAVFKAMHREPEKALRLNHGVSMPLKRSEREEIGEEIAHEVVAKRMGNVLSKNIILKRDHFPNLLQHHQLPQQLSVATRDALTSSSDVTSSSATSSSTSSSSSLVDRENAIPGVKNYRSAGPQFSIHGVAQTTIEGTHCVLAHIVQSHQARTKSEEPINVIWVNLREEPMIYINGKSYVLRDMDHPFRNMTMVQGIDATRLEEMEERLKQDLVEEWELFDGKVLVHDETALKQVVSSWETVKKRDDGQQSTPNITIQTPRAVFEEIADKRFCLKGLSSIKYARVPITPEHAPDFQDLNDLLHILRKHTTQNTHIVFNCQSGGGRSATGMVIALLHQMWTKLSESPGALVLRSNDVTSTTLHNKERLRRGEFNAIMGLVRTLHEGQLLKQQVDSAIDLCDYPVNLRESIHALSQMLLGNGVTKPTSQYERVDISHLEKRSLHYLERYFNLLLVNAYLAEDLFFSRQQLQKYEHNEEHSDKEKEKEGEAGDSTSSNGKKRKRGEKIQAALTENMEEEEKEKQVELMDEKGQQRPKIEEEEEEKARKAFTRWLTSKPEVTTLISQMRQNPSVALSIADIDDEAIAGAEEDQTLFNMELIKEGVCTTDKVNLKNVDEKDVILKRAGNVLVTGTILKSDHFPGCQRASILPHITGAPNFRKVEGASVYGVAQCTVEGVANILEYVQANYAKSAPCSFIWTNLREEPIVYINNRPFVVRQHDQPFANLEITGIEPERVEAMEKRLKKDILADAKQYGGHILIHDESDDGRVLTCWERVNSVTVRTLREVYEDLAHRGHRVELLRVPITDEKAPEEKDFDDLLRRLSRISDRDHLIFNCQMGRGRTTTGMVVACLFLLHSNLAGAEFTCPINLSGPTVAPQEIVQSETVLKVNQELNIHYHRGEFKLILRLIRVLKNGKIAKDEVDYIIDSCSAMQNLRYAIKEYKLKVNKAIKAGEQNTPTFHFSMERGKNYLERYFYLIAFNAFLNETKEKGFQDPSHSFVTWMQDHAELNNLLQEFVLE
ncbi:Paladin [Balamuthia mandrillaris]